MPRATMSIGIGLDGKAQIVRDFQDVQSAGEGAFAKLGQAIDQGTQSLDRQKQAFDRLTQAQRQLAEQQTHQTYYNSLLGVSPAVAGQAEQSAAVFAEMQRAQTQAFGRAISEAVDAQMGQMANFGGALSAAMAAQVKQTSNFGGALQDALNAQAAVENRAAALRAQIDPTVAAQGRFNKAMEEANTLLNVGAISQSEHAAAVAKATKDYDVFRAGLGAVGKEAEFDAFQAQRLGESFLHLGQAAASGGIAMRQWAWAASDFMKAASSPGGLSGILSGVFGAVFSGTGLAIGAGAAIAGGGIAAYIRAQSAEDELSAATTNMGRAAGLTRAQFENLAATTAHAADISIAAARGIESAFAASGKVDGAQIAGLTELVAEYYRKSSLSMDDASAALVKAFADPAKSGEQLLASMGQLDGRTKQLIDTMMQQGDVTRAQALLQDQLRHALKQATDQTTWYGDAWAYVGRKFSNVVDLFSHSFRPPVPPSVAALTSHLVTADYLNGQKDALGRPVMDAAGVRSAQKALGDALIAQGKSEDAALGQAMYAHARQLSLSAGPIVGSLLGTENTQNKRNNDLAQLKTLSDNAVAMANLGYSASQVAEAQDKLTYATKTYIDPAVKAHELVLLQIEALKAKTPAEKADIAARREALQLAGTEITTAEATQKIADARNLALAQATRTLSEQTKKVRENAAAWMAVAEAYLKGASAGQMAELAGNKIQASIGQAGITGAKQAAQIEAHAAAQKRLNDQVAAGTMSYGDAQDAMKRQVQLGPLLTAEHMAEGKAKAELARIIAALTTARQNDQTQQDRSHALGMVSQSNANLAVLRQQLAYANDNNSARQLELALLQERLTLQKANISLDSTEGRALLANVAAAESLKNQLQLTVESRGVIESEFDSITSKLANFFTSGQSGWQQFADIGISVLKELAAQMMTLGAINPLKNALFGTNAPTLDSVGGILGSMFSSPATATAPISTPGGNSMLTATLPALASSGNWLSDVGSWFAGLFHEGGMGDTPASGRWVNAQMFAHAPRYHSGYPGLGPNERPAILLTNERVLNPEETRAYNAGRAANGGAMGAIHLHYAPQYGDINATSPKDVQALLQVHDRMQEHRLREMLPSMLTDVQQRSMTGR